MSRKTKFQASLIALLPKLGGSHLTREARERTAEKFTEIMYSEGFTHIAKADDISGKQLRAYVLARKSKGVSIRTMQNELSHIRSFLKVAGKSSISNAPELTNKSLGISGGSRVGKKTAMSDDQFHSVCKKAVQQGRPGMAAILSIERHIGLRGNEAIHARQDTLERWQKELSTQGKITVLAGTKGGKTRTVNIHDVQNAIEAIAFALQVVKKQAGFLVIRASGTPSGGLKQARQIYHSWAHRSGIQPHAARYAFVDNQLNYYISIGYSEREALSAVSLDLGHGDGRGRWVKSVYSKRNF